jgi:citrate synthase
MTTDTDEIRKIIMAAADAARQVTAHEPEPETPKKSKWPIACTVGPGLEGAIACESKVGYVNGSKGWLVYRGYNIFDLCANSTFEEVCYLLLKGWLPNASELSDFKAKLFSYGSINTVLRRLIGFPVEEMSVMGALRLGVNLMRAEFSNLDLEDGKPALFDAIATDDDSIAMETVPWGEDHAIYEFRMKKGKKKKPQKIKRELDNVSGLDASIHLIAGVSSIISAVSRVHRERLPLEPCSGLSFAGNLIYMITGRKPTPVEERIMDVVLICHADHGMNASTFATMVVASTLADIYFSIGAGVSALSGPLHGGANEEVMKNLRQIGKVDYVGPWVDKKLAEKSKISGFGHRVYKAYDPRSRILGPLAALLMKGNEEIRSLYEVARELERVVMEKIGREKKIFPNVDFYSGLVYSCLGFDDELFTPMFAASRVAGWTSRVLEYMENNRIFRPRALYIGELNKKYVPIEERDGLGS